MSLPPEDLAALDHMPHAEVLCPDGTAGTLELLGTAPGEDAISHLIVRRGFLFQRDLLVPADWVEAVEPDLNAVALNAPLAEVIRLPEYHAPESLLRSAWGLFTLPLRLPWEIVRGRWQRTTPEVRDRLMAIAREARKRTLAERHVFDQAVTEPPLQLDLNTAGLNELCQIRGVGPSLAEKILEHRPYESIDDLSKRVGGVSPQTLSRLREIATFSKEG